MPKHKPPTPQELYWARKQAQEAYLPPGLVNHGNTCFMNSVLQGLIATRLLVDLAQFNEIPEDVQNHSSTPLLARRSPQLTNGHGHGGRYEQPWVNMPIGDRFIDIMHRSWTLQSQRRRESLSPKDLLAAVGRKYDQYLDFAQQDAHEFLRILLDAMRMEEQDVIKQRQPPPVKPPRKRRRSSQPSETISSEPSPALPPEDTLISFSDMIFGGKLTSLLVCQKCKHISQTYEDFNDISLSLKPEDYAVLNSRKRDKFKIFARKLAALPTTSLVTSVNASNAPPQPIEDGDEGEPERRNGIERMEAALQIQRSSSVPPSPREREDPQISEKPLPYTLVRRRSMEHLQSDQLVPSLTRINSVSKLSAAPDPTDDSVNGHIAGGIDATRGSGVGSVGDAGFKAASSSGSIRERVDVFDVKETESDGSNVIINNILGNGLVSTGEKHVEFVTEDVNHDEEPKGKEHDKKEKKKLDLEDSWTKISRRISMTVGLGRRDKEKEKEKNRSRSTDRRVSSSPLKPKFSSATTAATSNATVPADTDPFTPAPILTPATSDSHPALENHTPTFPPPPSAVIEISVSSLPQPLQHGTGTSNPQPPISTPKPVRSFSSQSHTIPRLTTQLQSIQAQVHKVSGIQRSRSPKPPKQSKEEQEYLRRILADVGPIPVRTMGTSEGDRNGGHAAAVAGSGNPLTKLKHTSARLHPPGSRSHLSPHSSVGSPEDRSTGEKTGGVGTWLPLAAVSQFTGLEECLRMFTAVEVLDGENMVGCRRCWKIQNGLLKGEGGKIDEGESEDEDGEEGEENATKDKEDSREVYLAPPLRSFDSQSSTSSLSCVESEVGIVGLGITAVPFSLSTPTLTPSDPTFPSDSSNTTVLLPPLPHRPSSNSEVESRTGSKHMIPSSPLRMPPTIEPPSHRTRSLQPQRFEQVWNTPGGLPIPRISTTPAVDPPIFPPTVDGIIPSTGVEDIFANQYESKHEDKYREPVSLPSSPSSRSSLVLGEETVETDEEIKKRRGMIFSDSLIVPRRMPGRSGSGPRRRGTESTDGDGMSSEIDGTSTSRSTSLSGTPDLSAESESAESEEENALDAGRKRERGLPAPPGLEGVDLPSRPLPLSVVTSPPLHSQATPVSRSSTSNPPPKPAAKQKRKKETILRSAYKRYLISVPPPVLVIHLKRFQQLNSSSGSSGLASLAGKIASGFSTGSSSGSYGMGGGRGFGGGGFGFGGGGFKKLEEFVSFPEWLDLSPFLAPRKEDVGLKRSKSKLKGKDGRDEEGRCMYRLYAVVVHIGNMLGGHYVSYVALPSQPPSSAGKSKEGRPREATKGASSEKENSEEASTPTETSPSPGQNKTSRQNKRQWAYISDMTVRLVSLEEVLNARAYICMYERV